MTTTENAIMNFDIGPFCFRPCRHGIMAFLRSDITIGRSLSLYGEFAECENRLMMELLQPGNTVIDVGTNVGTVALALARRVGSTGQIYAFEPQRPIFQAICATLALNGITHVKVFHAAVGAQKGEVQLPEIDINQPQNYGAVRIEAGQTDGEIVPLLPIDSLSLSSCHLIKIDVEGMDYSVLLGAEQTISRLRPYIYMEAKTGQNTQDAIQWLQRNNYQCYWHFATWFDANNYRGITENIFGNTGDINLLAIPIEQKLQLKLPPIQSPKANWQQDYKTFFSHAH
jgi:FkbM family methyltransferase